MITLALILFVLLVVWAVVLNLTSHRKDAPPSQPREPLRSFGVHIGDGYLVDERTVALTDALMQRKGQHGIVRMKPLDLSKTKVSMEIMFERGLFEREVHHHLLWVTLGGDPGVHDATKTSLEDDGSMVRVIVSEYTSANVSLSHLEVTGQGQKLIQPLPRSVWTKLTIEPRSNGLAAAVVGGTEVLFVAPEGEHAFNVQAKTVSNSGIRVRNVYYGDHQESISFVNIK
jgi:hypothetical protein